ncbi:MAG: choice-of-anchor A family protein [Myxococcota bacterium]
MSDYNGSRTIWAPNLFCSGKTALLTMQSGELSYQEDLSSGSFTGKAKVVSGGCGTFDATVWDVSFDMDEKASNTVPKYNSGNAGQSANKDDWHLFIVDNGVMTSGAHRVTFTNMPSSLKYGNQIGDYANVKDADFGGAFWFNWTREEYVSGCWVSKASGNGDFNYDLAATCAPGPSCPVSSGEPLGPASDYNVYTTSWMDVWNADIGGRAAVGTWAKLANYGLNTAGGSGTVFSVADNVTATNSQLYGGDGEAGGTCSLTNFGTPNGDMDCSVSGAFDAGSTANTDALDDILDWLAVQPEGTNSASVNRWWPQLIIDGDDSSDLNIVNVDTCAIEAEIQTNFPWASNIQGWDIKGKSGSTLVINLEGNCPDMFFQNGYMGVSGVGNTDVLWAVHDMTDLDIRNVSLQGSLLAPNTDVTFDNGNIDGQLISASLKGTGEAHLVSFAGDICP